MDKRLLSLVKKIPPGKGVIDVGTDHGYIPVYLACTGYSGNIFASDINAAPLETGISNAKEAGVENRIGFIHCNGLEKCPKQDIDTILIAGMGGDTICGILDRDEWVMDQTYLLILQPMTKAEILRYWLTNNGFEILSEDLCEDGGRVYQIITSRFGAFTALNDAELFIGKHEQIRNSPLFYGRLLKLIKSAEKSLSGMENAAGKDALARKKLMKEIYWQYIEMKARYMEENNADH